jgi:histidine triad (HIT) family protein
MEPVTGHQGEDAMGAGPTSGGSSEERAACLFCRIVDGEAEARVVLDDDVAVAFLDVRPVFPGHVLVVPRRHVVTLPDLDPEELGPFFERVQLVAAALPGAVDAQGTFVANNNVVSQSVAHLHVHVVPRTKGDGLKGFFWPRTGYDHDDHAEQTAASIRAALGGRGGQQPPRG